jgi:hypothetical protein
MATRREAFTTVERTPEGTLRVVPTPEEPAPLDLAVVAELRRLLAEASDGPWWFAPATGGEVAIGSPERAVASGLDPRDAELLVVARSHLAALLDEVERLRAAEAAAGAGDAPAAPESGSTAPSGTVASGLRALRRGVGRLGA